MSSKSLQPDKPKRIPLELMVLGICVLSIFFLNNFSLTRETSLHSNATVNVPIVGEWQATDGHSSIVFRADRTIGVSSAGRSEPAASEPGAYTLGSNGTLRLALDNGKNYWATLLEAYPNRFDLIDAETGGVTAFERATP
ncbi:hypothetical protein RZS28_12950 [Methylocapsa polymorpha]|uniref:Uncharacterized protein n=1 Tax=Methylocapsa polymorpha TaxID=3080828 RepID=A0ABZ0HQ86_9HYPH|nr:hypothetical protein RZS28_12950 [Methylocapsa sp. RX1]